MLALWRSQWHPMPHPMTAEQVTWGIFILVLKMKPVMFEDFSNHTYLNRITALISSAVVTIEFELNLFACSQILICYKSIYYVFMCRLWTLKPSVKHCCLKSLINSHFCWFTTGLVAILQHADLARLLFQVQAEGSVMSGLCKSVYTCQKLWHSSTCLLWTALSAAAAWQSMCLVFFFVVFLYFQLELMSLCRIVYPYIQCDLCMLVMSHCFLFQSSFHLVLHSRWQLTAPADFSSHWFTAVNDLACVVTQDLMTCTGYAGFQRLNAVTDVCALWYCPQKNKGSKQYLDCLQKDMRAVFDLSLFLYVK